MTDTINLLRGAFAIYEPDDTQTLSRFIPFRFNPEVLTRQLTIEQGQGSGGQGATSQPDNASETDEQGADADSGSLKEAFTVLLRFDLAEREEASSGIPVEYGVLPEISALEDLLHPAESEAEQASDGSEPVRARPRRPTVLFIWGERRVLPVKITGMTINETVFNAQLYPIRAEVEVSLETLSETDVRDNTRVSSSFEFTANNRRKMAKIYLETTADQGSNVNLPM
jgi:hypothetical protein